MLFVASECSPLAKTGGLGDVCASLPAALRSLGIDARILMPGYPEVLAHAARAPLARLSALGKEACIRPAKVPGSGVPILVLDCPSLYAREGGPYQSPGGSDWPDNALRFGFLSKAAALLSGARSTLRWRPEVLHCNDWQSALAPVYLAREHGAARTVLTVHNLAFQGNFELSLLAPLGLPRELGSVEGLEFYGKLSFLKGGLRKADCVTTVSPTYAAEILTPELGCGMDGILRQRRDGVTGLLNGIDEALWNPASDSFIPARYDARSLGQKKRNKRALQSHLGLPEEDSLPLLACVGRMTHQKGADLLLAAGEALAAQAQLVLLGTGSAELEQAARSLAARLPSRVAVRIGFDEALAHLVEAGADIFLMPSRFEPCGLNQMYSQRYGTPPVARATGGLADTIEDGRTGFFFREASVPALLEAAGRALSVYRDAGAWERIQRAGMARDFSWDGAARRYADLYLGLKRATPQAA